MQHSRRAQVLATLLLIVATVGVMPMAQAQIRVVDGNLWAASSKAEKRAYLIGVANTVAVNREVQKRAGKVDSKSPNDHFETALNAGTIDNSVDRIDAWYAANPSRKDTPVLGVVWMELVRSRLSQEKAP